MSSPIYTLILDESDRQLVLMALAHLAVERPGWDDALLRIAVRLDPCDIHGRPALYSQFKDLHSQLNGDRPAKS